MFPDEKFVSKKRNESKDDDDDEDLNGTTMEEQLNHLYQAALHAFTQNAPALAKHYLRQLKREAQQANVAISPDTLAAICPACSAFLIPGWTVSPAFSAKRPATKQKRNATSKAKQPKQWLQRCLTCQHTWSLAPQSVSGGPPPFKKVPKEERLPSLCRQPLVAAKQKKPTADPLKAVKLEQKSETPPLSKWSLLHAEKKKKKRPRTEDTNLNATPKEELIPSKTKIQKKASVKPQAEETDLIAFLGG